MSLSLYQAAVVELFKIKSHLCKRIGRALFIMGPWVWNFLSPVLARAHILLIFHAWCKALIFSGYCGGNGQRVGVFISLVALFYYLWYCIGWVPITIFYKVEEIRWQFFHPKIPQSFANPHCTDRETEAQTIKWLGQGYIERVCQRQEEKSLTSVRPGFQPRSDAQSCAL